MYLAHVWHLTHLQLCIMLGCCFRTVWPPDADPNSGVSAPLRNEDQWTWSGEHYWAHSFYKHTYVCSKHTLSTFPSYHTNAYDYSNAFTLVAHWDTSNFYYCRSAGRKTGLRLYKLFTFFVVVEFLLHTTGRGNPNWDCNVDLLQLLAGHLQPDVFHCIPFQCPLLLCTSSVTDCKWVLNLIMSP